MPERERDERDVRMDEQFLQKENHEKNFNKTDRLAWIKNEPKQIDPQQKLLQDQLLAACCKAEEDDACIFQCLTPKAHARFVNIKAANRQQSNDIIELIREKYNTGTYETNEQIHDADLKNLLLNLPSRVAKKTTFLNRNKLSMLDDEDEDYMNDI